MQRLSGWLDAHVQRGFGHINADKLLHYRFIHCTHPCKNAGLFAQATVRVVSEKPARRSLLLHGLGVPKAGRAAVPDQTALDNNKVNTDLGRVAAAHYCAAAP